ncbi:MAG: aldehyde dehydrogenase (NADP(+)) [Bacteroidota bacterium]
MIQEKQIIGFDFSAEGTETFASFNPATGANNDYLFYKVSNAELDHAAVKAAKAFQQYRKKSGVEKAIFLEAIAEAILASAETLIEVCCNETALPKGRIEGELGRATNQLKMFSSLLREGSWVDARIETALPGRAPVPKPDLRFMHIGIGPVVVFGTSNFPLAFSVAGGDTASALAAGCPVIVKAHAAHPATSAIIGKAIQQAAINTNMPDGVFSLLFDNGIDAGIELVKHPLIKAVGFTGSFKAGKALFDAAVNRPVPIPVYAEMGSTNPVFILPQALRERGTSIAAGYAASVTLGVGQFCTNPGVMIYPEGNPAFQHAVKNEFEKTNGGVMLAPYIAKTYSSEVSKRLDVAGVEQLAQGQTGMGSQDNYANSVLLVADKKVYNQNPLLGEEVFGPSSVMVEVSTKQEMLDIAEQLTGHLTCTVFATDEDLANYVDLIDILEQKAGRLIVNNFPTGVEVCAAMVHGGPFPATTDSRTTSVGTAAIYRFTRPVCYQNLPQHLLAPELKNQNSLGIFRLVNGTLHQQDLT